MIPIKLFYGVIVRDDKEEPGEKIIKLDDGRYVLATECQYSIVNHERRIKYDLYSYK